MTTDSSQDCAICNELRTGPGTRLSRALGDDTISNATLMISDHFAVIPSVGPLVVGHNLVVTRGHSNGIMAGLPQSELPELRNICERSMEILVKDTLGLQLLCFEHGSRCELKHSLCSTGHGHLHHLPLPNGDVEAVLNAIGGQWFEVDDFREISDSLAPFQEYIVAFSLIPERKKVHGVVLDAAHVSSQHLRKLIADRLGIAGWDWKVNMNGALLRQTLALGFQLNKRIDLQMPPLMAVRTRNPDAPLNSPQFLSTRPETSF
jgi:hypothetical protein